MKKYTPIFLQNIILTVFLLQILLNCKSNHQEHLKHKKEILYTCSMDPQIIEHKPGKCPICKMELTKVESQSKNENTLKFSDNQLKLGNIKVGELKQTWISEEINLNAKIVIDETETKSISSRIMGRIDRLFFKTEGEFIKKGDLIYSIYSEELAATQKDLLATKEKMIQVKDNSIDYKQIYQTTKKKLRLWGLTEKQISDIEKSGEVPLLTPFYSPTEGYITEIGIQEGDYLMQGQMIYQLNSLSTVWIEAQTFSNEMNLFEIDQPVSISFETIADKTFHSKIAFISPELIKNSQVNVIRIELPNKNKKLYPGMIATVLVKGKQKQALTLPLDAVIQEAKGNIVWIQNIKGSFENRMVEIGMQNSKQIEIISGIEEGEKVVISGAYLLNSEYKLKKGANTMEGHNM